MEKRIELNNKFTEFLGNRNVYFQPPESVKLKYPCIIYERQKPKTLHADNKIYFNMTSYKVTIIDPDCDSLLPHRFMETFDKCSPESPYVADNLHHFVFTLFY